MTSATTTSVNMTKFPQTAAFKKLKELAAKPFDLTIEGNLTPDRLHRLVAENCGFKFLYGTERVDDKVMQALHALAEESEVLKKMHAMQDGEIVNRIEGWPCDHRAVLHTAQRDLFDTPRPTEAVQSAVALAKEQHEKLKSFLEKTEGRFTDLVAVAIGGSDLGPKAIFLSMQKFHRPDRRTHFVSNIDPDAAASVLPKLDLKKTLVVVISKSGTTLETVANEEFLRDHFEKAGLNTQEHFVSVTAKGSPMDDSERYLESFHMWDYVGGRFSGTSMGGCVTLGFAYGYPALEQLLKGAHDMDKAALDPDLSKNLPLLGALLSIWNHNFLGYPMMAFVPYSEALFRFPAHIQQVVMESNGKRIDRQGQEVDFDTGPVVWGEPGTSAQHSFYQLIHQGTLPVPLELVGFKDSQWEHDHNFEGTTLQEKLLSNLFAQAIGLAVGQKHENPNKVFPGNRPSHIILGKQLTPYALGALFAYVEHKVAFEGFIWDINTFDQEGVELGKVLANKIVAQFANERDPRKSAEDFPLGKAFLDHLKGL